MFISKLLFGNFKHEEFGEDDEFKYKLLIILLVSGALFTLLLILASDQGKITNILSHKSEIDRPIWV